MDKTLITIALISAFPPTLVGVLGYIQGRKTHKMVNSRMTELLDATKGESIAQGKEEGKIEEREEVAERKEK